MGTEGEASVVGDGEMSNNNFGIEENVVIVDYVTLEDSGASAVVVTLNRPDRLNCFDARVCRSLSRVFYALASSDSDQKDIVAVILRGAGTSFCAGADLTNPPSPLEQSSDLPNRLFQNPVHHMERVKVPILAAIRGHCITGGFELALACDILVGDSTVRFRDTHVKFGLAPCWGLSQRLQRRIGPGRAKLVSFTAQAVDGRTAHSWGLLDEFVDTIGKNDDNHNDDVLARALELADLMAQNDATMVRRYKHAIVEGGKMDLARGLQQERALAFAHYWETVGGGGGGGRDVEGMDASSSTLARAKQYIQDSGRSRSRL